MTLYLVGLGLGDEKDITVKGLDIVKKCKSVYLESYTSVLGISREKLEAFYGRPVTDADRDFVEQQADTMLDEASEGHEVAMLVVGDPFGATTHADLVLRAREKNIKVEVVHNASIMNAIGATGLQLYLFGQAVSIPFWTDTWKPTSFYDKIKINVDNGFHTLCLLDIKVKEQSIENLMKGRKIYEPPRFMTTMQCIDQLVGAEEIVKANILGSDTKCFAVARVGQPTQAIVSGTLEELRYINLGAPLHSFIICGPMHLIEEDFYKYYHVSNYLKLHPDAKVEPKPENEVEE